MLGSICHICIIIPLHQIALSVTEGDTPALHFAFQATTMRLFHTRKLKLEEFANNKVPRYAILSHTWGAEEVTLQDIKTDEATRLLGYEKAKNACSVALASGY